MVAVTDLGDNCIKIIILGGISSDKLSEFSYTATRKGSRET